MSEFDLLTDQTAIQNTQWRERPACAPPPGGLSLEMERFALTANNFTYAKFGAELGYWRYFPAPEGWGRIPVWGLARIIHSAHPQLQVGERVFGFLPISTQVTLAPDMRGALRFVDASQGRADLPPAYNEYALIDRDLSFEAERADAFIALRPLFLLGFVLAEWLVENQFFGADQVIVSSASSKAALALAHQLQRRVATLGLTSPRHIEHIKAWGLFADVASYADMERAVASTGAAVFIDIAGDRRRETRIRALLEDRLFRVVRVGATHGGSISPPDGAEPSELFFAPAHIPRLKAKWGAADLRARLAEGWLAFLAFAGDKLAFPVFAGRRQVDRVYGEVARGEGAAGAIPILTGLGENEGP